MEAPPATETETPALRRVCVVVVAGEGFAVLLRGPGGGRSAASVTPRAIRAVAALADCSRSSFASASSFSSDSAPSELTSGRSSTT